MENFAFFRRRVATEAELEEGRRQIEEAERRMAREGLEMVWGERPGGVIPRTPQTKEAPRSPLLPVCDEGREEVAQSDETELRADGDEKKTGGRGSQRSQQAEEIEEKNPGGRGSQRSQQAKETDEKKPGGRGPQRSQQVEDMKEGEGGEPPAKTPEEVEFQPLFNEEQLRRLEQLEQSAPLLIRTEPQIPRPRWMIEEERKAEEWKKEQERMKEMREQQRIAVQMKDDKHVQLMERLIALEKENLEMKKAWQESQVENRQIKEKLKVMLESPRYDTPQEEIPWGGEEVQRRPRSCRRDRRRSRDPPTEEDR